MHPVGASSGSGAGGPQSAAAIGPAQTWRDLGPAFRMGLPLVMESVRVVMAKPWSAVPSSGASQKTI